MSRVLGSTVGSVVFVFFEELQCASSECGRSPAFVGLSVSTSWELTFGGSPCRSWFVVPGWNPSLLGVFLTK